MERTKEETLALERLCKLLDYAVINNYGEEELLEPIMKSDFEKMEKEIEKNPHMTEKQFTEMLIKNQR